MYKHVCASSAGRGRRVQATSLRQTARTGPASAEIKPSYRKEQISLGRFGFSQLLFSARLPILGVLLQAVGTVPPSDHRRVEPEVVNPDPRFRADETANAASDRRRCRQALCRRSAQDSLSPRPGAPDPRPGEFRGRARLDRGGRCDPPRPTPPGQI
jgi:hypothetical protein